MTPTGQLRVPHRRGSRSGGARGLRVPAVVLALSLGLGLLVGGGPAVAAPSGTAPADLAGGPAATSAASYDKTSSKERARVDKVPTPKPRWSRCRTDFRCASVKLPLDYDRPRGATTTVALLKHPARTRDKIGTLFVNPGGPGDSGVELAAAAPAIFPAAVLDRFDIVGFDPRGVGGSSQVRCFSSTAAQDRALAPLYDISFPDSLQTAAAYLRGSRALGQACASTGKPLSVSMSTAQVARDLDVLRRAVGDRRLSYLGFSYGTYVGQVYANLFPDRTRALVLDGVVDPTAWQGSTATRNDPQWNRIRAAEGSKKALDAMLSRCGSAGPARCAFASHGDPAVAFAQLAVRLRTTPLLLDNGAGGSFAYGYDDLVGEVLDHLYAVDGAEVVDRMLEDLWVLTEPAPSAAAERRATRSLLRARRTLAERRDALSADVPYDNGPDAFTSVGCTDSPPVDRLADLPDQAAKADARVPYFGALWVWNSLGCGADAFGARDEDAYRGSFTRRTRAPLLFVGNAYDPVTSLAAATKASRLAPNAVLVASQSWGHTAYNTSACVTGTVDRYLLTGKAPSATVTCTGDYQPYDRDLDLTVDKEPVSEWLAVAGRR